MFVAGMKRAEIARELGVTRATIGNWAKSDAWEGRLESVVDSANRAADFATSDIVAASLMRLKSQMTRRVAELEALCSPANHPSVRLRAIQLWLKLAGIDKAMPDPINPKTETDLHLVEDLIDQGDDARVG
jgi:transcriptional regulator with XRE-family HTH domain